MRFQNRPFVLCRILSLHVLVIAGSLLAVAQQPDAAHMTADALTQRLDSLTQMLAAGKSVTTRDLTNGALATMLLSDGKNGLTAAQWVAMAYATQDMDASSTTYGELRWQTGDSTIT